MRGHRARVRLVPAADDAEWDALVAAADGGTGFHDRSWLHLQARLFGWRFEPLLVERAGRPVGVLPLITEPGPLPHAVRPPFPYAGPLVPPALLPATLAALRRHQARHALPVVRFEFAPGAPVTAAALAAARCRPAADATFVLPLERRSAADVERGMSPRRRRALRLADEHGVAVRDARPGEVAALLPPLFAEAYGAHGGPSHYPAGIGAAVEGWLRGRADVHATTVLVDGEPAGLQVALAGRDTVYAWAGAAFRTHRQREPFTVLAADLFRWALERGHRAVDLVGHVDAGVAAFKRSLGGIERPYLIASSPLVPPAVLRAAAAVRDRRGRTAAR